MRHFEFKPCQIFKWIIFIMLISNKWLYISSSVSTVHNLVEAKRCKTPRCYHIKKKSPANMELHNFCDATEKAYSAVAYWRTEYEVGKTKGLFVIVESRVAPIKVTSIPWMYWRVDGKPTRLNYDGRTQGSNKRTCIFDWLDEHSRLDKSRSTKR